MSCFTKIEYEIRPKASYKIIRNCPKCSCKSDFINTNVFRVNANGNQVDVWLIYQCEKCKHTYNLSIYERVRPTSIKSGEYKRFMANDTELALEYGMNKSLFARNKAEINLDQVNYEICLTKKELDTTGNSIVIKNPYELKVRSDKVLSEILSLARSQVKRLLKEDCSVQNHIGKNTIFNIMRDEDMKDNYILVKNYKDNEQLRKSLNELAGATFGGLNFENWYQSGYWKDKYIPYSIVDDGIVVANVSANIMDFCRDGIMKHYIQIGTVMTKESYRKQGLSRFLMEAILSDYLDQVDGFYLWGNDSVVDFYPKFGFQTKKEIQYRKNVENNTDRTVLQMMMNEKSKREALETAIVNSAINSRFQMDNLGLIMFYVVNFMGDCVYYLDQMDAYVIAEINDTDLLIHNVFTPQVIDLEQVIQAFGRDIKSVTLGFTPLKAEGYEGIEVKVEDSTFFVLGKDFDDFESQRIMFPTLSHA